MSPLYPSRIRRTSSHDESCGRTDESDVYKFLSSIALDGILFGKSHHLLKLVAILYCVSDKVLHNIVGVGGGGIEVCETRKTARLGIELFSRLLPYVTHLTITKALPIIFAFRSYKKEDAMSSLCT